ncbi:hypothetical protein AOZ07_02410 [Glutamicibacter halophytocola]|nr:hypothetical protein AOZ07_02410 [Glutamicibacter halophytocola]
MSIAFSKELLLNKITERLVAEFDALSGDETGVLGTLRNLADRIEDNGTIDENDFEQLVGSFESQAALLSDLAELAALLPEGGTALPAAIEEVRNFTSKVLSRGTGIVLKTILEASDSYSESAENINKLFREIDNCFAGTVTFANLNYDILVLKTLLGLRFTMCDMGKGYGNVKLSIMNDRGELLTNYSGKPLRTSLDFPEQAKFRLVHPHGSLTYWKNTETGVIGKVPIEALRSHDLFSSLGASEGKIRPAVVLANSREKQKRVKEYPFNLAYQAMSESLKSSDHWLIVGYSFRDESVNSALRIALANRKRKPMILVSTFGDELTKEMVLNEIGWDGPSIQNVYIDRGGVEGLERRWDWNLFNL